MWQQSAANYPWSNQTEIGSLLGIDPSTMHKFLCDVGLKDMKTNSPTAFAFTEGLAFCGRLIRNVQNPLESPQYQLWRKKDVLAAVHFRMTEGDREWIHRYQQSKPKEVRDLERLEGLNAAVSALERWLKLCGLADPDRAADAFHFREKLGGALFKGAAKSYVEVLKPPPIPPDHLIPGTQADAVIGSFFPGKPFKVEDLFELPPSPSPPPLPFD